jgi:hypothetical protein
MDGDQIHEGIEDAIIDEIGSSHCNSLLRRAAGSCGHHSAYDVEDKIQHIQALEEPENSMPPSSLDPQLNQMSEENKRHTKSRDIFEHSPFVAAEERLREKTIELHPFPQQGQEEQGEDDIQTIGGENNGTSKYCQQTEESPQQHGFGDESINATLISQGYHHSAGPGYEDDEGHLDDENEDTQRSCQRKRRRMPSDAIDTLTRKKHRTPSSAAVQSQTCTARGSTAAPSSLSDTESVLGADFQEHPFQGFIKCMRIGTEMTYFLEFKLPALPDSIRSSINLQESSSRSYRETIQRSVRPQPSKGRLAAPRRRTKRPPWTTEDDAKVRQMYDDGCSWEDIHTALPGRTKGAIQVRYSTKLKHLPVSGEVEELPPKES